MPNRNTQPRRNLPLGVRAPEDREVAPSSKAVGSLGLFGSLLVHLCSFLVVGTVCCVVPSVRIAPGGGGTFENTPPCCFGSQSQGSMSRMHMSTQPWWRDRAIKLHPDQADNQDWRLLIQSKKQGRSKLDFQKVFQSVH
mmetsp:Transcript_17478/g.40626  ORF Transcript_17478/g.40626 Transcript_17478/m.40626 type:complete len:139 (-) Transcript_17478:498-914(-)